MHMLNDRTYNRRVCVMYRPYAYIEPGLNFDVFIEELSSYVEHLTPLQY